MFVVILRKQNSLFPKGPVIKVLNVFVIHYHTVEPRFNEGARGGQICFVVSRFFSIYFTITGARKIVGYTEDFVI